jgi:hypothetical protein
MITSPLIRRSLEISDIATSRQAKYTIVYLAFSKQSFIRFCRVCDLRRSLLSYHITSPQIDKFWSRMSHRSLSSDEINQILRENGLLIKLTMKCQNEGRMMDAMLYQTRLQLNLVQLAAIADSRPHPGAGPQAVRSTLPPPSEGNANSHMTLSRFVLAVKEHGLKNIGYLSKAISIPIDKIAPLARAYIAFLKRENRFSEATQLENELAMNGLE